VLLLIPSRLSDPCIEHMDAIRFLTSILSTPARRWCTPFVSATVEDTDTTTWNSKIELVRVEIAASVGGLNDHLLARSGQRSRGEGELVARAAPVGLGFSSDVSSSEAICQGIADCPRALVGTHVSITAVASILGTRSDCEKVVVDVADTDRGGDVGFARPATGWHAAVW